MKSFLTAEDIENIASQGQSEISYDGNTVLTDSAKQTAQRLGIQLVFQTDSATTPRNNEPRVTGQSSGNSMLSLKPRGCQRHNSNQPSQMPSQNGNSSNPTIDSLVEATKLMKGTIGSN